MYITDIHNWDNHSEIIDFIKSYNFGLLVSIKDLTPVATHLPFFIEEENKKLILYSHFSRANTHWEQIESEKILVIFQGPHSYISPINYDSELSVPTWNYISVHLYGEIQLIHEKSEIEFIMNKQIQSMDIEYYEKWKNLPTEYKDKMFKGIMMFRILVEEIQGKKKLSQNKNQNEIERIIDSLSKSNDSNEKAISRYMREFK